MLVWVAQGFGFGSSNRERIQPGWFQPDMLLVIVRDDTNNPIKPKSAVSASLSRNSRDGSWISQEMVNMTMTELTLNSSGSGVYQALKPSLDILAPRFYCLLGGERSSNGETILPSQ